MGQRGRRQRQHAYIENRRNKAWKQQACENDMRLGTKLGTLGYLPPEIRSDIWKHCLVIEMTTSYNYHRVSRYRLRHGSAEPSEPAIGWHMPRNQSIFNPNAYRSLSSACSIIINLRCASPSIRFEIEQMFLSTQDFLFADPDTLAKFCKMLPNEHRNRFRHIMIYLAMRDLRSPRSYCLIDGPPQPTFPIAYWTTAIRWLPSTV